MRKLAPRGFIAKPVLLSPDEAPPSGAFEIPLAELCRLAGIAKRVTGGYSRFFIHPGRTHFHGGPLHCEGSVPVAPHFYVGYPKWKPGRTQALRVLEVLVRAFQEWAASESLNERIYPTVFSGPRLVMSRRGAIEFERHPHRQILSLPGARQRHGKAA